MSNDSSLSEHAASEPTPRDQLRILDLLIWTACVAACLGWLRFELEYRGVDWGSVGTEAVEWGLHSFVLGTADTAIFLVGPKLFARRRQRPALAPGEWLWIILGVEAGVRILLSATEMLAEFAMWGRPILYFGEGTSVEYDSATLDILIGCYWFAVALLHVALAGVAGYVVFKTARRARWRAIFGCLALMFLLESLGYGLYALFSLAFFDDVYGSFVVVEGITHVFNGTLRVFPALFVLITLFIDWRSHHAFPWKHWMGSIVFLGALVRTASFLLGWP